MIVKGTLTVVGMLGPFSIVTDDAVDALYEQLADEGEHVIAFRDDAGVLRVARIQPNSVLVVESPTSNLVTFNADVDDVVVPAAERTTGLELTEDDRARQMRDLEANVEQQ